MTVGESVVPFEIVDDPGPLTCEDKHRNAGATPARLRRLTAVQWSNTVTSLLGGSLPAGRVNPFDDGLSDGRFSTDVTPVGLPVPSLSLLLDSAESLAGDLAPRLKMQFPCLAGAAPDKACVEGAFSQLGAKTFRRPLTAEEVTRLSGAHGCGL